MASINPANEHTRQRALDSLHLVGSLPEQEYQDIVQVAAAVCGAPIALISRIDRNRQWFKAKVGLEALQTDRSAAVCDHAIRRPGEMFEVADLKQDDRFAANDLLDGLGARFYAGMPLVTDEGMAIGTVCVLDTAPRTLNAEQRRALESLSRITISLIESRSRARVQEVASILEHTPAVTQPDAKSPGKTACRVVVLEVVDLDAAAARLGERALFRHLTQLDAEFEACIDMGRGDTINRVTDSGEFIAVLAVNEDQDVLAGLRSVARSASARIGINLRIGEAGNVQGEPIGKVFLRAEEDLREAASEHPIVPSPSS